MSSARRLKLRERWRHLGTVGRTVAYFTAFSVFYFVLPPAATVVHSEFRGEVYPLSMWSMFHRIRNTVEDFGLRVHEVDGEAVRPPQYVEHLETQFSKAQTITAYYAIQKLGRAAKERDSVRLATAKEQVEQAYLKGRTVDYEIVERKWDPFKRYRAGTFISEAPLWRPPSQRGDQ